MLEGEYGIVFAYEGQIVYNETFGYNLEKPNKLWFNIPKNPGDPYIWAFTPDEAIFIGSKKDSIFKEIHYVIEPMRNKYAGN
jgi:hypothetical protein